MMKPARFALFVALTVGIVACKKDAEVPESQKDSFIKFYGTAAEGVDMVSTGDGGFLLLGTAEGKGSKVIYLVKTDAFGNQSWSKTYKGSSIAYDNIATGMAALSNGNYAISGTIADETGSSYLLVVNGSGGVVYDEVFSSLSVDSTALPENCWDVIEGSDGKMIICGDQAKNDTLSGYIRVIDPNDNYSVLEFIQPFQDPNDATKIYDLSFRSMSLQGDLVAVCGFTTFGTPDIINSDNMFRNRYTISNVIDGIGNEFTGGPSNDVLNYVLVDGTDMIVAGYQSEGSTAKLFVGDYRYAETTNDELWTFVSSRATESAARHIIKSTNGYAVCGYTTTSENGRQLYLMELSANDGSVLWESDYGFTEFDESKSLLQTSDGGYALLGTSSDERGNRVMCMIKTDARGNVKK